MTTQNRAKTMQKIGQLRNCLSSALIDMDYLDKLSDADLEYYCNFLFAEYQGQKNELYRPEPGHRPTARYYRARHDALSKSCSLSDISKKDKI
jgi:hypothetical protein